MAPRTESRRSSPASSSSPRLQKYLADLGYGSRRELERWIEAGRISVNGTRAELGQKVHRGDVVRVDGRRVGERQAPARTRVLRYHKPVGEVCSRAPSGDVPSVFANLPSLARGRWIGVGRLDITTSGLLLFTNQGELAHRLMHPANQIEREYAVRIRGEVTTATLNRLRAGVELEDGLARFASISRRGGTGVNQWFHVVLNEGRNREVRRLWESQSLQVSRLIRVRFGPVELRRSPRAGRWEEAEPQDVQKLLELVGLQRQRVAPTRKKTKRHHGRRRPAR